MAQLIWVFSNQLTIRCSLWIQKKMSITVTMVLACQNLGLFFLIKNGQKNCPSLLLAYTNAILIIWISKIRLSHGVKVAILFVATQRQYIFQKVTPKNHITIRKTSIKRELSGSKMTQYIRIDDLMVGQRTFCAP